MRKYVCKSMVAFTLTLIRHGETKANKENVIQGQSDVPLSDAGIRQAQLLGQRLQNQKYSHVFASDLSRAKQTAQTILDKNLCDNVLIVEDLRLRERKFGDVEGKHVSELRKLASCANQINPHYTPIGGETLQQVRERAILFFQDICQQLKKADDVSDDRKVEEIESENLSRNVGVKRRRQSDTCTADSGISLRFSSDENITAECKQSRIDIEDGEKQQTDRIASNKIVKSTPLSSTNGNEHNLQSDLCKLTENAELQTSSNGSSAALLVVSAPTCDGKQNEVVEIGSVVANVLVVSHGGLLKELIRHFVEDLDCKLPPGSGMQAFKISPNTGLSKFTVCLRDEDKKPTVTCHLIHDDNHLLANGSRNDKIIAI
uniref:Fructose-2,6-bisphosphatase TIGAR n=1 Tax=Strigamia maritima TaxID=126957 RepID=T1JCK4_STRMM